jgi:peptide/nickel transport system substrate-binding protein
VTRVGALTAAIAVALITVAGGAGEVRMAAPKRGGTVTVVWGAREFACLNPLISPCKEVILPIGEVIEGAFKRGPDYSWRPDLVSDVAFTMKPPFTLTYHIRPEARWSDGVPVTASDFVFTYHARLRYPEVAENDPYTTVVESVRTSNAKTVRVVLRSRYAYWRRLFSAVLPAHALRGQRLDKVWIDRIDDPKTGTPIGSGPFLVSSWQRGRQLTLIRNPEYWGAHVSYLDRVVVRFVSGGPADPAIPSLFRNRRADVGTWQFTDDLASGLARVPGVERRLAPAATGWEHLDIRQSHGGNPALRDKLVRRALAYGIDRVAIARAVFQNADFVPKPLDSAVLRSTDRFYQPNWRMYRYAPAQARDLLEQAGCRRGEDGIYSCNGERLSLHFVSRGSSARRVRTLELVQAELKQAGIEVIPEYAPSAAHNQILASGDFDVTLFAWFGPGAEDGGIDSLYGCGGDQNYTGYCQRLVTRDLDQSDRILDRDAWGRVLNRADAQLAKDVPVIPLFEVPSISAVRSTVHNYVPSLTDPTWNAVNWWLER